MRVNWGGAVPRRWGPRLLVTLEVLQFQLTHLRRPTNTGFHLSPVRTFETFTSSQYLPLSSVEDAWMRVRVFSFDLRLIEGGNLNFEWSRFRRVRFSVRVNSF